MDEDRADKEVTVPAFKRSLASWLDAHGFGILCIRSPLGERFVISRPGEDLSVLQNATLTELSESAFRSRLEDENLSAAEIDEAVDLAREWATTFEGPGNVFWDAAGSHRQDR